MVIAVAEKALNPHMADLHSLTERGLQPTSGLQHSDEEEEETKMAAKSQGNHSRSPFPQAAKAVSFGHLLS